MTGKFPGSVLKILFGLSLTVPAMSPGPPPSVPLPSSGGVVTAVSPPSFGGVAGFVTVEVVGSVLLPQAVRQSKVTTANMDVSLLFIFVFSGKEKNLWRKAQQIEAFER